MSHKPSLLIVDDDDSLRQVIANAFEWDNYKVFQASGGRGAFDIAIANSVEAVVSDIRMPGGDGIELLTRLKERGTAAPIVILITGFTDFETEAIYDLGAEAVFHKPFQWDALESAVATLARPKTELWTGEKRAPLKHISTELKSVEAATKAGTLALGRGGMQLSVICFDMKAGDEISFDLTFSEDPTFTRLSGAGVIRWIRALDAASHYCTVGIEFLRITPEVLAPLTALIDRLNPKPYIPKGPGKRKDPDAHA